YGKLMEDYPAEMGPEYYFRYAQTLRTLGDYESSKAVMAKFSQMTAKDLRAGLFKTEADHLAEIAKNSGRYQLGEFKYNSRYSDLAPTFYKEGLIFASDRDTGNLARNRHTWNGKDFLDLYQVNVDSSSIDKVVKLG